jgi:phosphoglycolate phosphatase
LPGSGVAFTFAPVRPRGIVFDLDGTLVDTLTDIADAMNDVLRAAGYAAHAIDAYRSFVGWGAADLVRRAAPEGAPLDTLHAAFLERYHGRGLDRTTRPYEGIPQLLAALVERRIPLAVLSNKPHAATVAVVARFFAEIPFVAVVGACAEVPNKPNPASALAIADSLKLTSRECAFVGDTEIDIETAQRAGMIPVGVAWGFRAGALAGAAYVLDSPFDLLARL